MTNKQAADSASKIAGASRLYVDKARELVDEYAQLRSDAEAIDSRQFAELVEGLDNTIEALTAFMPEATITFIRAALAPLFDFDAEPLDQFIEAYETLAESVDEVEAMRDDPSGMTPDEKEDLREQCREALESFAEALENMPEA